MIYNISWLYLYSNSKVNLNIFELMNFVYNIVKIAYTRPLKYFKQFISNNTDGIKLSSLEQIHSYYVKVYIRRFCRPLLNFETSVSTLNSYFKRFTKTNYLEMFDFSLCPVYQIGRIKNLNQKYSHGLRITII